MKFIIDKIRSFMLAFFILYLFNKIAGSIYFSIPINIVTILIIGILKIPGLILLIILKLII